MSPQELLREALRALRANALRSGNMPWAWLQTVSLESSNKATAQEGPIEPCDW